MTDLLQTLGGVGLFLYGMATMTSGLRKLAGDRLRRRLARSTRSPLSGAVTGATATALVQSSSAVTVAAVGFVGAGLISFSSSLGVIFGANIGTTITGWMVALLGFKLKLGEVALPLIFVAAFCYLFKQVRPLRGFGKALAGFCLLFLGISFLQDGLEGYRDRIDLAQWSAGSFGGRAVLVLIGIALTLVTQSSSATVATALTALNASILDLPQAAAVIIGADIGTTGTAALATIGGTAASRRTGFAHVVYNLMTGVAAFFFLPLYLLIVERPGLLPEGTSPEVLAVGFHSVFNTLGVILVLPLTRPFGRFIEWLIPEKRSSLAILFDKALLKDAHVAIAGLKKGCSGLAVAVLRVAEAELGGNPKEATPKIPEILSAVQQGREFAVRTGAGDVEETEIDARCVFDCIHLIDHVERLAERSLDREDAAAVQDHPELRRISHEISHLAGQLASEMSEGAEIEETGGRLEAVAREREEDKVRFRQRAIRAASAEEMSGERLDDLLDAHRWLRRMAYHAARIAHYSAEIGR